MALVELYRTTGERRHLELARADVERARPRAARRRPVRVGRTGRTTARARRDRPSPATPSASCTSTAAPSTSPTETRRRGAARRRHPALARHGRDPDVPDRRARQPPSRRGVRRPVRAAARPRLRRDVRGDRQRHARLAAAARDRRPGLRRRHRADDLQRRPAGRLARRDGVLLRQPAAAPDATGAAADRARASAQPWFAVRLLPAERRCARSSSWPQYLATTDDDGIQIHQYATAEIRADVAGRRRPARDRDGLPVGRRGRASPSSRRRSAVDAVAADPGLVRARRASTVRGRRRRGRCRPRARSPPATERHVRACGRPATRSSSTSTCRSASTEPDPAVDAIRGCVALERGPLVYCIETADLAGGTRARGRRARRRRPARRRSRAPTSAPAHRLGADRVGRRAGDGEPVDARRGPLLRLGATGRSRRCGSGSRERPTRRG